MRQKKLAAAILAAVTAITPLSMSAHSLAPTIVFAEETGNAAKYPDWVPTDFESALKFRNTYGTTHIQDGLLCLVFNEERECERKGKTKDEPHYRISASDGAMEKLKDDTYGTENSSSDYEVVVFKPLEAGNFEISLIDNWVKSSTLEPELGYVHYLTHHTFSVDKNKNITETDRFSWMPDCITEYQDYVKKNGEVSVKDDLIIFCLDSAAGTPYTWQQMSTGFGDHADLYEYYDCSKETEIPLDGGTIHLMKVFKATNDGYVTIGLEYRDLIGESDKPAEKTLIANCVILDNAKKVLFSGDVNGDKAFNIADVVSLQNWLLGKQDVELANWETADFSKDGKLNVFDMCLMKRALFANRVTGYVEPDVRTVYGEPLRVIEDGLKLYLGPDESYPFVASLPKSTRLREYGYQNDNHRWIFTEYNGQFGWIRIIQDDDMTYTVYYELVADKPVIYLYPEQETDVHVELELTEADLSTTYPKYNNGWDVTAFPDGTLLNKADGTHHKYLFWDAVNCRTRFDFTKGFCVAGGDTEAFLREKLTCMGLTEQEMNEFIVYWLPRMEHNKYNLISFQGNAYTNSAKLNITPSPDGLLRIFMAYIPLEESVDIEPQQLDTFERNGFTVVEWGGCEVR